MMSCPTYLLLFFFSSRRRHTRCLSDWSSDVCSSDLACLRGKKTLINYRSGEARDHLRRFRTARPVLAGASGLVVPSRYLVDVFREFGLEASMVPNIVDLTQFSFRERNPVRPHLVCTRGFHPYYCLDVVFS